MVNGCSRRWGDHGRGEQQPHPEGVFRALDIDSSVNWAMIHCRMPLLLFVSSFWVGAGGVSQLWASMALADICCSGMGPLDWDHWVAEASPLTSRCSDKKMFMVKRREQLLALKNLAQLNDVHQQYKILDVMLKGLFKVRVGMGQLTARSLIWALIDKVGVP